MNSEPPPDSPQPLPPGYYRPDPQDAIYSPARRAGVLMFVLGGLLLTGGFCSGLFGLLVDWQSIMSQPGMPHADMPPEGVIRTVLTALGIISVAIGFVLVVLGVFVRRANLVAIIISLILTGLMILLSVFSILADLVQGSQKQPQMLIGVCFWVLPLALLGVLLAWLIQSIGVAKRAKTIQPPPPPTLPPA